MSRGRGRPRIDHETVMARVCDLLANGEARTLRQAAKKVGVHVGTICQYAALPEYSERYARAREAQAENIVSKALYIALKTSPETVNADRLKVDTLKWFAAKLWPRQFGDRQAIEFPNLDELTDEQLEKIAAGGKPNLKLVRAG